MHADDFRLDRYGVVSGLRDGGYSDDMTLAAIAGIFSLTFSVQSHSIDIAALILADYGLPKGQYHLHALLLMLTISRGSQEAHHITSSCCLSSSPCK